MALIKLNLSTIINTDAIEVVKRNSDHVELIFTSGRSQRVDDVSEIQAISDAVQDLTNPAVTLAEEATVSGSFWSRLKGIFG